MTIDEKLDLLIRSVDHMQRSMDTRFDKLEKRVDNLEKRMDKADDQIEKLGLRLHQHIEKYNEDQKIIQTTLFKLEKQSYDIKYILDKQQEHDMAIHRLQMQLEKR